MLEAAVVGLPDERMGEVPAAVVRLAPRRDPRRGRPRRRGPPSASPTTRCPALRRRSTSCRAPAPTRSRRPPCAGRCSTRRPVGRRSCCLSLRSTNSRPSSTVTGYCAQALAVGGNGGRRRRSTRTVRPRVELDAQSGRPGRGVVGHPALVGVVARVLDEDGRSPPTRSGNRSGGRRRRRCASARPSALADLEAVVAEADLDVAPAGGQDDERTRRRARWPRRPLRSAGPCRRGLAPGDGHQAVRLDWRRRRRHAPSIGRPDATSETEALRGAAHGSLRVPRQAVLRQYGIPVSPGEAVTTVDDAVAAAERVGYPVVVKAQVQVGGRGKAGGIKLATDADEVPRPRRRTSSAWTSRATPSRSSGSSTPPTSPRSTTPASPSTARPRSTSACCRPRAASRSRPWPRRDPDAIAKIWIDPVDGLTEDVARAWVAAAKLNPAATEGAVDILPKLYTAYVEGDADLVEINPLILTPDGRGPRPRRQGHPRRQRRVPPPRLRAVRRHPGARRARAGGPREGPAVRRARRLRRRHRQRRRAGHDHRRRRQPGRRQARQLPRHRRRRQRRRHGRRPRGHQQRPQREVDLHQHLRRHHQGRRGRQRHRRGARPGRHRRRRS